MYGDEGRYGEARRYGDEGRYGEARRYGDEGRYGEARRQLAGKRFLKVLRTGRAPYEEGRGRKTSVVPHTREGIRWPTCMHTNDVN